MLKLTNRKTVSVYAYKYVIEVNGDEFQILSNLDESIFRQLMCELSNRWEEIEDYSIKNCFEFNYTNENDGITIDVLRNYL